MHYENQAAYTLAIPIVDILKNFKMQWGYGLIVKLTETGNDQSQSNLAWFNEKLFVFYCLILSENCFYNYEWIIYIIIAN